MWKTDRIHETDYANLVGYDKNRSGQITVYMIMIKTDMLHKLIQSISTLFKVLYIYIIHIYEKGKMI